MTTTCPTRAAALTLVAVIGCCSLTYAQQGASTTTPAGTGQERPSSYERERPPEPAGPVSPLSSPRLLPRVTSEPPPGVWRDLFAPAWGDARRFPSKRTLGWVTFGLAFAAGVRPADSHVGRSLSDAEQLREVSEPGALIGSTPLQLGLSAAVYAVGRARHSSRTAAVGADLFRAQVLAQGLTMGLKEAIRRRRPEGGGFAFPSGHTTVSFASATVLQQHFGWRVGAPVYALATYVALSRVQMKRHYLSDVAFGAALGIAAGRTITLDRQRRMQLAPIATAGGGGVQFIWNGRP